MGNILSSQSSLNSQPQSPSIVHVRAEDEPKVDEEVYSIEVERASVPINEVHESLAISEKIHVAPECVEILDLSVDEAIFAPENGLSISLPEASEMADLEPESSDNGILPENSSPFIYQTEIEKVADVDVTADVEVSDSFLIEKITSCSISDNLELCIVDETTCKISNDSIVVEKHSDFFEVSPIVLVETNGAIAVENETVENKLDRDNKTIRPEELVNFESIVGLEEKNNYVASAIDEHVTKIEEKVFSITQEKKKYDNAIDVKELVERIKNNQSIESVILSGNTFGVEAFISLASSFKNLRCLRRLDIGDCFTGRLKSEVPKAVEAVCEVLVDSCPELEFLDISDNAFGPVGAKAVSLYLSKAVSLKELISNNNGYGPEGGSIIAQALIDTYQEASRLGTASNLRRIEIGRNRLENGSCELLSKALESHTLLETIAFPQNGIRVEGIKMLSSGVSKCTNLKSLNLQDNTFTDEGSVAFAKALEFIPDLEYMNVGDCLLGVEGVKSLIKAMPSALKIVDLSFDEIDPNGLRILTGRITEFKKLEKLCLNGNAFDPDGQEVEELRQKLQDCCIPDVLDELDEMDFSDGAESEDLESEHDDDAKEGTVEQPSYSMDQEQLEGEMKKLDI